LPPPHYEKAPWETDPASKKTADETPLFRPSISLNEPYKARGFQTYRLFYPGRSRRPAYAVLYHGRLLHGSIKASTKEYRGKTIKHLFKSWPALKTNAPAKVTETECRHWAAEYRGKFSETLFNNTADSLRQVLRYRD